MHDLGGLAALASVLYVGRRRVVETAPHSIPLVALGTGLALVRLVRLQRRQRVPGRRRHRRRLPEHRPRRLVRGHRPGWSWTGVTPEKPHFLGLLTGAVAGLATITPAAGLRLAVSPRSIIGIAAGVVCYCAVALKNRLQLGRRAGRLGRPRRRRLPRASSCSASSPPRPSIPPAATACCTAAARSSSSSWRPASAARLWAFAFTWGMLWLIDQITPVRVGEDAEGGPRRGDAWRDGVPGRSGAGRRLARPLHYEMTRRLKLRVPAHRKTPQNTSSAG